MTREEVIKITNDFLVDEIEVDAEKINDNARLREDLGIDSIKVWTYENTGEVFEIDTEIKEDITLWVNDLEVEANVERTPTSLKITVLSLFVFVGMLTFMLIDDLRTRRR